MQFAIGDYVLDTGTRQLLAQGREVHLSPKAFDLLRILVERSPSALSKADLMDEIWPETYVTEGNLSVLVSEIRQALGDDARRPRFVRTVPRHGYALVGTPDRREATRQGSVPASRISHWLVWGHRKFELLEGEQIVGRDPHCEVHLEIPGVSRRHARFRVEANTVTIEDLGSKNGTNCRGESVTDPVELRDGDGIDLGPVGLVYRCWSGPGSTVSLVSGTRED